MLFLLSFVTPAIVSFNRYMVECEFEVLGLITKIFWVFNRYMVECEFF